MQKTIEKIHRKFDTAGEKLLAQAKEILAAPVVDDTNRISRFNSIGFSAAKPIKVADEISKKKSEAALSVEAVEYYQVFYPNYKFITEKQIEKICKKYGLFYGESKTYLGDIPEKNLTEIEAFKLREEDFYEEIDFMNSLRSWGDGMAATFRWSIIGDDLRQSIIAPAIEPSLPDAKKVKPSFKICAPKKDFNTQGYEVKEGYKLVYDPIVIQPVKYKQLKGGLIVSKWGLEGQDESLVNEVSN